MIDLAIDLVCFMRLDGLIEANPTATLLDMALRSNDPVVQKSAAEFIRDHSSTLLVKTGIEWPEYITFTWPQDLSFLSRNFVLEGLIKGILACPRSEWDREGLNACVVYLIIALRSEKDTRLKANIGLYLEQLLTIFPEGIVLFLPDENLNIDTIRRQVADTNINIASSKAISLLQDLKNWLEAKTNM